MTKTRAFPFSQDRALLPEWAKFYAAMPGKATALAFTATLYTRRLAPPHPTEVARQLFGGCDRAIYGSRFYNKAPETRVQGFVVAEDWHFHPHFHGVVHFPAGRQGTNSMEEQITLVSSVWAENWPGGVSDLSLLTTPETWMNYVTKKCARPEDEIIHAFQFMNRRRRHK